MDERANSVLDWLRAELRDLTSVTLALAADTSFLRRRDDRDVIVGRFVTTHEQRVRASAHHKRLHCWVAAVQSVLRRRTTIDPTALTRIANELDDCVLLSFTGDRLLTEKQWRDEFRRHTLGLFAELGQALGDAAQAFEHRRMSLDRFPVAIEDEGDGRWRVTAALAEEVVEVPFTNAELTAFQRDYCRPYPKHRSTNRKPIAEFGQSLFAAAFTRSIGAAYRNQRHASAREGRGVRVEIRAARSAIPWELLHDGEDFLCLSEMTPIVRVLSGTTRRPHAGGARPLHRILVTLSAPASLSAISVDAERARIAEALSPLECLGSVQLDIAPDGTLNAIRRLLRAAADAARPYDVWHFVGHGGFDETTGRGALAMTTVEGAECDAGLDELVPLFREHSQLQLVVLNACDSIDSAVRAFVEDGVPAVIAMQSEISNTAAVTLAAELYAALADGASIESAMSEARRAVFFLPNATEWFAPVLFLGGNALT